MNRSMILLFWLVSAAVVFAQQGTEHNAGDGTAREKFVSGGTIRMHLEAGSYTIEGSDSPDIVATCKTDTAEQLRHVRVLIRTNGTNAELSVKGTPHNNFHATIEVPRLSHLWLRLSAGDLSIKGIEGDKDVESHAGDVDIEVAHPEDYAHRDASVLAGSIDASAFNVSKDGLWRSFRQDGKGKYRLHVHLAAGDVTLRGPS